MDHRRPGPEEEAPLRPASAERRLPYPTPSTANGTPRFHLQLQHSPFQPPPPVHDYFPPLYSSASRGLPPTPMSSGSATAPVHHLAPILSGHAPRPHYTTSALSSMTLAQFLDSIGLTEYHDLFVSEGFSRMESLVEIQEVDLESMKVKRGHRRLLQREIATIRGIPASVPLCLSGKDEEDTSVASAGRPEAVTQTNQNTFYLDRAAPAAHEPGTKRRYRRHPKPDASAPDKPPSAYVDFSNSIREEFKDSGSTLSFTEIARLVGERWSGLDKTEKERLESIAAQEKVRYAALLAAYKTTPAYAQYQDYLADFRKKHPAEPAATPPIPTSSGSSAPPLLVSRSSAEDSPSEAPGPSPPLPTAMSDGRYTTMSLPDFRKRQRLDNPQHGDAAPSVGPTGNGSRRGSGSGSGLGDSTEMQSYRESSEHPTSDVRNSSRPPLVYSHSAQHPGPRPESDAGRREPHERNAPG